MVQENLLHPSHIQWNSRQEHGDEASSNLLGRWGGPKNYLLGSYRFDDHRTTWPAASFERSARIMIVHCRGIYVCYFEIPKQIGTGKWESAKEIFSTPSLTNLGRDILRGTSINVTNVMSEIRRQPGSADLSNIYVFKPK